MELDEVEFLDLDEVDVGVGVGVDVGDDGEGAAGVVDDKGVEEGFDFESGN